MTFSELQDKIISNGMHEGALWSMMDIIEDETGTWPDWNDPVPQWILDNFGFADEMAAEMATRIACGESFDSAMQHNM